jgi:hypothetical protein
MIKTIAWLELALVPMFANLHVLESILGLMKHTVKIVVEETA